MFFGILLVVLVLGIHQRLQGFSPNLSQIAAAFGLVWVGLVIATGMIANIALNTVIAFGTKDPTQAIEIWRTIEIITEGLGGGNEIVGGMWVLILSIAAIQGMIFPKLLNYLGLLVGLAGILTIFPK